MWGPCGWRRLGCRCGSDVRGPEEGELRQGPGGAGEEAGSTPGAAAGGDGGEAGGGARWAGETGAHQVGRGEMGTAMGGTGCRVGAAYVSSSARDWWSGVEPRTGVKRYRYRSIEAPHGIRLSKYQCIDWRLDGSLLMLVLHTGANSPIKFSMQLITFSRIRSAVFGPWWRVMVGGRMLQAGAGGAEAGGARPADGAAAAAGAAARGAETQGARTERGTALSVLLRYRCCCLIGATALSVLLCYRCCCVIGAALSAPRYRRRVIACSGFEAWDGAAPAAGVGAAPARAAQLRQAARAGPGGRDRGAGRHPQAAARGSGEWRRYYCGQRPWWVAAELLRPEALVSVGGNTKAIGPGEWRRNYWGQRPWWVAAVLRPEAPVSDRDRVAVVVQDHKKVDLGGRMEQSHTGVAAITRSIDSMRQTRDSKLADIDRFEKDVQVCCTASYSLHRVQRVLLYWISTRVLTWVYSFKYTQLVYYSRETI